MTAKTTVSRLKATHRVLCYSLPVLSRTKSEEQYCILARPVERVGVEGVSYPGPRDVWGALPSARNIKYTRMYHFEKKNQKFSPQRDPVKMFGGPVRMFPRAPLWLSTGLILGEFLADR